MLQNELLELIPIGKENAISNYDLALESEVRILTINRLLKKLVKYQFVCCCADKDRHYKSKVYYKNE